MWVAVSEQEAGSAGLSEVFADWLDDDVAAYRLGVFMGIFSPEQTFSSVKRMFWTDGYPLGRMLTEMLESMAEATVLLKDEDGPSYKWNPDQPNRNLTRADIEAGRR
jgi:hypothetical protein